MSDLHALPLPSRLTMSDLTLQSRLTMSDLCLPIPTKHLLSLVIAPHHVHNTLPTHSPGNMHRRNAAERAIRTFRNHFIAGFRPMLSQNFPLHLWDHMVEFAPTLCLLRASRINNPKLSANQINDVAVQVPRPPTGPTRCLCCHP